jgi:hypothetical protein
MIADGAITPSLWSELKASLLDLARALRPPVRPQLVPVPVRPARPRRTACRRAG